MGALELKMFLDVLGDRSATMDHVSTVLLRLSELLEAEGHDSESIQARELSYMVEGDGKAVVHLEEVLGALECDTVEEFEGKKWVEVPSGVTQKDAETIVELLAEGLVKIPEE